MLNKNLCSCALFLTTLFYCQALQLNDVSISVGEEGNGLLRPFRDGSTITVAEQKRVHFMFLSDYPIETGRCYHNEHNFSMVLSFSKDRRSIGSIITASEHTEGSWHCLFSSVRHEFMKPTKPNIMVVNIRVNYILALIVLKNNDTSVFRPDTIESKLYLKKEDSFKATCQRALVYKERLSVGTLSWSYCMLADPEKRLTDDCQNLAPTSRNLITFRNSYNKIVTHQISCVYRSNYSESTVKLKVIVQPDNIEESTPYEQVSLPSKNYEDSSMGGLAVSIWIDGNDVTSNSDPSLCSAEISADQEQVINITIRSNYDILFSECKTNFTYVEENNLYGQWFLNFSPTVDLRNWKTIVAVSYNVTGTYSCAFTSHMDNRNYKAPYECIIKISVKSKSIVLLVCSIVAVLILFLAVASVYILYRWKRSKSDTQQVLKFKTNERVYYTIDEELYSYVSPAYVKANSANGIYQNDVDDDNK